MEQLQRRRQGFRVSIRRSDLYQRMNLMRTSLTSDFQSKLCQEFINRVCATRPSSLFIELSNKISTIPAPVKRSWAMVSWNMLTSLAVSRWNAGKSGLSSLILNIIDQLNQDLRRKLSVPFIIEVLLDDFERSVMIQGKEETSLFRVAFQLSIYASKQSKFHINLNQSKAEEIITRTHANLTTYNLQLFALFFANFGDNFLSGRFKSKLKQIARRIYNMHHLSQDRLMQLRVLALIGIYCPYEPSQIEIIRLLLDPEEGLDLTLALRFLSKQSQQEWMSFKQVARYLQIHQNLIKDVQQVNLFLDLIASFCYFEGFSKDTMDSIYSVFFSGKLHHFVRSSTIYSATKVINAFIIQLNPHNLNQLIKCARLVINMGKYCLSRLQQGQLGILCSFLQLHDALTQKEMCDYLGEENFRDYWDEYIRNTNNDC